MADELSGIVSQIKRELGNVSSNFFNFRNEAKNNDDSLFNIVKDAGNTIKTNKTLIEDVRYDVQEINRNFSENVNKTKTIETNLNQVINNQKQISSRINQFDSYLNDFRKSVLNRFTNLNQIVDNIALMQRRQAQEQQQPQKLQSFKIPAPSSPDDTLMYRYAGGTRLLDGRTVSGGSSILGKLGLGAAGVAGAAGITSILDSDTSRASTSPIERPPPFTPPPSSLGPAPSTSGTQQPTSGTTPYINILAKDRKAAFEKELENPAVIRRLYNLSKTEVGKNPINQQLFSETVFNRSMFSGRSLSSTMSSVRSEGVRGGYYPVVKNYNPSPEELERFKQSVINKIMSGANNTSLATDNASLDVARRRIEAGVEGQYLGVGKKDVTKDLYYSGGRGAGRYRTKHGIRAQEYQRRLDQERQEQPQSQPSQGQPQSQPSQGQQPGVQTRGIDPNLKQGVLPLPVSGTVGGQPGDPRPYRGGTHSPAAIDIAAKQGTPIYAPAGGRVLKSYTSKSHAGSVINIQVQGRDGNIYELRNYHLSGWGEGLSPDDIGRKLKRGEPVYIKEGQIIGYVGGTGRGGRKTFSSHLHVETHQFIFDKKGNKIGTRKVDPNKVFGLGRSRGLKVKELQSYRDGKLVKYDNEEERKQEGKPPTPTPEPSNSGVAAEPKVQTTPPAPAANQQPATPKNIEFKKAGFVPPLPSRATIKEYFGELKNTEAKRREKNQNLIESNKEKARISFEERSFLYNLRKQKVDLNNMDGAEEEPPIDTPKPTDRPIEPPKPTSFIAANMPGGLDDGSEDDPRTDNRLNVFSSKQYGRSEDEIRKEIEQSKNDYANEQRELKAAGEARRSAAYPTKAMKFQDGATPYT